MTAPVTRLSVILLTDHYGTIRRVVEHLCAQTVAGSIELVIGCPASKDLGMPAGAALSLARVAVVEAPLLPMGAARAAAVRATTSPVVVLGETHAFPSPRWAEELLRAHEGPWDAVAPGMENANPESARSWSGFLMDYGRWFAEHPEGAIAEPPAYNVAWKRARLMGTADRMASMLEPGGPMDPAIARDARFGHAPNAKVAHVNVRRPLAWAAERFWGGRLFGARRSHNWPLSRRVIYFGGSALVPLIRFVRTQPALRLARRTRALPAGAQMAIAGGSVLWALGEAMGYIAGEGRSEAAMMEFELHKEHYA